MRIEAEQGYLVIAQNTKDVDYIQCARVLAKSLKSVQPDARICLLTDELIEDACFDYVRTFPYGDASGDSDWKLHNDWQCFYASPFRQTIKLESDMIIPHRIDHWFQGLARHDLVLSVGARNWHNELSPCRDYRRVFDDNGLLDVYNAVTYWRLSRTAETFFSTVRDIIMHWSDVMQVLKYAADQPVNTDLAYALAADVIGRDRCTAPLPWPSMIHMKPRFNNLQGNDWTKELIWEIEPGSVRINTVEQMWPFHYHEKSFAAELTKYYD